MNSNAYQNETSCKRYHLYIVADYLVSNSPGIQESRVAEIEAVFRFFVFLHFARRLGAVERAYTGSQVTFQCKNRVFL